MNNTLEIHTLEAGDGGTNPGGEPGGEPREANPEISPPGSPYIDIPQPDAPAGPLTSPEQPVPVRGIVG